MNLRSKQKPKPVDPTTARREVVFTQLLIARRNLLDAVDHFADKVETSHGRLSREDSRQWSQLVAIVRTCDKSLSVLRQHVRPEVRALADDRALRLPEPVVDSAVPDTLPEIAELFPDLDWS